MADTFPRLSQLPSIIAIDGPAASGKTTLGLKIARRLGYLFFDTGVMYRAITWAALQKGLDIADEAGITRLAETAEIDLRPPSVPDGRTSDVLLDGEDITWQIRQREVEAYVSQVSAYPGVRQALGRQQRRIGLRGRVVMVGRDIGTVILPEAEVKIYLDASAEERARRRWLELKQRGQAADYEQILADMRRRDQIDSNRQVAPLRPAEDAIRLDSDHLNADQAFQTAIELIATAGERLKSQQ